MTFFQIYLNSNVHKNTIESRSPRGETLDCTKLTITQWGEVFEIVERLTMERRAIGNGHYFKPAVREWMGLNRPIAARGLTKTQWNQFGKKAKRQYKKNSGQYKVMALLGLGDRMEISRPRPSRLKISHEIKNLMAAVCWKLLLSGQKLTSQKVKIHLLTL